MGIFPSGYKSVLTIRQTEGAIKFVRDTFERELSGELRLSRATAPMFVEKNSGINDDLNGVERPVSFKVGVMNDREMEVVQSLAKWKRLQLYRMKCEANRGIYTNMNAIRPDDLMDNTHSIYVDQWDWCRVLSPNQRNIDFLKTIVQKIYNAIRRTEFLTCEMYPAIKSHKLPGSIKFIYSEDAQKEYPDLTPEEREAELAKKYRAIFIIGIGGKLADGVPHGFRAPDYDDWTTPSDDEHKGLNGDIILWDEVRQAPLEISSMGIRVNKEALLKQLEITKQEQRKDLYFHRLLLEEKLPDTIGGGIGQSRLCMYLLRKAHIGEVQSSVWSDEILSEAEKLGINIF